MQTVLKLPTPLILQSLHVGADLICDGLTVLEAIAAQVADIPMQVLPGIE